jgi:antitoxin ParD1/3/4
MNVSIPDKLKNWAESRVAEGRHGSTSDYVRGDQEAEEARRRLQAAIDEGRASGPARAGLGNEGVAVSSNRRAMGDHAILGRRRADLPHGFASQAAVGEGAKRTLLPQS